MMKALRGFNNFHKNTLRGLHEGVNVTPGKVYQITYQPALKGKRYAARERTVRTAVPYGLFISMPEKGKGGPNILTHILDIDQTAKNRDAVLGLMQKSALPIDPKFTDDRWFKESLEKMAQAHAAGKKSTDGTGLSDADRDFLQACIGSTPQEGGEPIEGRNLLLDTIKA